MTSLITTFYKLLRVYILWDIVLFMCYPPHTGVCTRRSDIGIISFKFTMLHYKEYKVGYFNFGYLIILHKEKVNDCKIFIS